MWWTQPKLALIAIAANALVFVTVALSSNVLLVQLAWLLVGQTTILLWYARTARYRGMQHLDGKTEAVFATKVWNKSWTSQLDACQPPDIIPREKGGSFYQQVLGDAPIMAEALYGALSMWEGARLLWVGNTIALALALGSSTIGVAWAIASNNAGPVALIAAMLMPLPVLVLPEVVNIMLLKRSILRHGAIPRTAVLVPRDAVDLGLRQQSMQPEATGSALESIIIVSIVGGIPFLMLVGFIAGLGVAVLSLVSLVVVGAVGLWAFHAFLRLLVNGIPFLNFGGPIEVSVVLDLAHRQRAYLSLSAVLPLLWVGAWYFRNEVESGLLSPWPFIWLGYLIAMTFGDQLSGYAGFFGATRFHECFKRSLAKMQAAGS